MNPRYYSLASVRVDTGATRRPQLLVTQYSRYTPRAGLLLHPPRVCVQGSSFTPVPNVRNPSMLVEAEDFAKVMMSYKHALKAYAAKIDSKLCTNEVCVGCASPCNLLHHFSSGQKQLELRPPAEAVLAPLLSLLILITGLYMP